MSSDTFTSLFWYFYCNKKNNLHNYSFYQMNIKLFRKSVCISYGSQFIKIIFHIS